jgi:outer membrane protein OmpA-like peptidoglycan-associated protein
MNRITVTALRAAVLTSLLSGLTIAQPQSIPAGQKTNVKGVIASRSGADMTIQQDSGANVVAVLGDYTQVQVKEGLMKFRKKSVGVTMLIPGLRIEAEGVGNAGGQLIANKISFSQADYKNAREIQAGTSTLAARQQQLAAQEAKLKEQQQELAKQEKLNQQQAQLAQEQAAIAKEKARLAQQSADLANNRISNLDNYDTRYTASVLFATGSIKLSPEAKSDLSKLATEALATNAYMIQVTGFASKTGSVEVNERLSEERADTVMTFLTRTGKIPMFRMLAPGAVGESSAAGNDPKLNQRVVVKVLVNKGIAQ